MMIDTHAHLHAISPIAPAIQRAGEAGVDRIVAVGMDWRSNETTLALAEKFPDMVGPAVGYHPWSITPHELEENIACIKARLEKCAALGEVGLDYKVKVKKPLQKEALSRLLIIAKEMDKPVILHSRYAHERLHRMVVEAGITRAVFHWFSGPLDMVEKIIADGYFVSATPALAYSPPHRAVIERAPLEKILIETDAPVEYQGEASEPRNLLDTLAELSRIKGKSIEELSRITGENARKFFDF